MTEDRLELDRKLRELNRVKREIDDAKGERSKKLGKLDGVMERMGREFGVKSIDDGQKEVHNINQRLMRRNKKISEDFDLLTKEYDLG